MSEITKTEFTIDYDKLLNDYNKVMSNHKFNDHNQICFVNTQDSDNDVYQGTGDIRLAHSNSYGLEEKDFTKFNTNFNGTIFEEIYKTFPYEIGRMRLMKMGPKKCYWLHNDPGLIRYHFAVVTNPGAFILYEKGNHYHIPADGYAYEMDANTNHTALNSGREDRIHLVLNKL